MSYSFLRLQLLKHQLLLLVFLTLAVTAFTQVAKLSDNLGNHTATKALNLNNNKITGVYALSNTTADTIVLLIGGEVKKIGFSNFLALLPAQMNSDWNVSSGIGLILNKPTKLSQFSNDVNFLTANQTITASGDATGSGTTSLPLTLNTVNNNVYATNSFLKFSVNAKGLVTGAGAVSASDITTALGYTPLSANQTITVSGDMTGSGTTAISTSYNNVVPATKGGAGSVNGLLKANGSGTVSAAVAGADYQSPIILTTSGSIGAATLSGNTLNIPVYAPNRTPNIVGTRPVDGSSFRLSTTRDAEVKYSIQINCTSSTSSGSVYLEYSSDNSTWVSIGQVSTNLNLIFSSLSQTFQITGYIPAGYWIRLRSVTSSSTVTYMYGQEILY